MKDAGLKDRHVIVTGAGTGIGRAIALRLAAEGARLALLARGVERLEETAALAREAGAAEVHVAPLDIRRAADVDAAFDRAATALGPLTALVANSGIGGPNGPPGDAGGEPDRFEDLVATNLSGTYSCLRAAERHLAPGPQPRHLLIVSSILARIGVPAYTGYCASKAGLLGLTRALAMELAPLGVQVNALCPGWVDTAMAREGLAGLAQALGVSPEEAHAIAMRDVPLGRMGQPEEVAAAVAWLLGEGARGMTGQGVDINGGAFMH